MDIVDFIMGGLVMNAMPHFIFGITKTHFLGLFGFSPRGNIFYAMLQLVICLVLFHYKYTLSSILENGILIGCLTVLILYFLFGKILLNFYN